MKRYLSFVVIFSSSILSLILLSCSSENGITSPTETKSTKLAKVTDIPKVKFDPTKDTLITLPKSGKTMIIGKNITPNILTKLDDFLVNHTISSTVTPTGVIVPGNTHPCFHCEYSWISQGYWQLKTGYHMGIWVSPDRISWPTAYNQYGFNELFVSPGDLTNAVNAGYKKPDSLMLNLGSDPSTAPNIYLANKSVGYGYYYVDEPQENGWTGDQVNVLETNMYNYTPNAKFMFSEWKWPDKSSCDGFGLFGNYSEDNAYLYTLNSGIMCDLYNLSDICGNMDAHWTEYLGYYGLSKSWTNRAQNTSTNMEDWGACFDFMNNNGFTNVWLYADETGTEQDITNWVGYAWDKGWNYQQYWEWENCWINLTCDGVWPNGNWTVFSQGWDGQKNWIAFH